MTPPLRSKPFSPQLFLKKVGGGKTVLKFDKKHIVFSQGDASDAVFYVQGGQIKLTVVSHQGKEAVVAILEPGSFFGEACLAGESSAWRPRRRLKIPPSCALRSRP